MVGIFQTAEGNPHWPSILQLVGWLIAGAVVFAGLVINRNERLRNGPWIFDATHQAAFSAALSDAHKGKIAIEYSSADKNRSYNFAVILKNLLEKSGYDVWGYMPTFHQASGSPITGIELGVKKGTDSDAVGAGIQDAFGKAGIKAEGRIQPNNNYEDDRAVIYVGIKP